MTEGLELELAGVSFSTGGAKYLHGGRGIQAVRQCSELLVQPCLLV